MTLDASDVIAGRTSPRTSPLLIVGFVGVSVALAIGLLVYVLLLGGPVATFVAMLLALPTCVVCIALVLLVDRLEPEPRRNLVFVFLYGAGVSALVALIVNTLAGQLFFDPAFGKATGSYLGAAVGAPIVEETAKGSVLLILLARRRQEIDGPTDGIVYAAMVALGFAFVENINYYIQGLESPNGLTGVLFVVFLRGIASPLLHPIFTSMTGLGVAYAATHSRNRVLPIVGGFVAAMCLHGFWNGVSSLGLVPMILAYVVFMAILAGYVVIIVRDRTRIARLIGRYLPAYAGTGAVKPQDVVMLSTLRGRRRARAWIRLRLGMRAGVAMSDYQLAATELALLHARADNRAISPPQFQQRQQALVAVMRSAHAALFGSQPPPPWAGPGGPGAQPPVPPGRPVPPGQPFPSAPPPQGPPQGSPQAQPYQQGPPPVPGSPQPPPGYGPPQGPPPSGPQQGPPPGYGPPPGDRPPPGYGPR